MITEIYCRTKYKEIADKLGRDFLARNNVIKRVNDGKGVASGYKLYSLDDVCKLKKYLEQHRISYTVVTV